MDINFFTHCDTNALSQYPYRYKDTKYFLAAMSLLNENLFEADRWDDKTRLAVKKYRDTFYEKKYFDYSLIMQEMLHQLHRLRRGDVRLKPHHTVIGVDGRDHTALLAARGFHIIIHDGLQIISRRGFALGSADPDQMQLLRYVHTRPA